MGISSEDQKVDRDKYNENWDLIFGGWTSEPKENLENETDESSKTEKQPEGS